MAWSDHRFSDQFAEARNVFKNEVFPDAVKTQLKALQAVMTDSGFEASAAQALDDLRGKVENIAPNEPPGTMRDARILSAAGHAGSATGAIDGSVRSKAAALKFLSHIYLLKQRGGQKTWLHSLPADFNDWPHWAIAAAGPDAARALLRASNERFSADDSKNLSTAMLDAMRWCQKALSLLADYNGAGKAKAAAEAMIKRWFGDENSDATQLGSHSADLTTGFKAIRDAMNRNQIVLTDFPSLRAATGGAERGLRISEAFVWGKASREKLDVIYVEDEFFGSKNTMKGSRNWTRILIHELSHLVYGTADVKPGPRYSWYGIAPNAANFPSAKAVTNADNWAFFAADCADALTESERNVALTVK